MKKVQILLSTYNGEKFIKEQLDSILNQTYKNIEILIRDDGSTDSTLKILKDYENNSLISLYKCNNVGVCASFFDLIKKADANASYFAFADQDDFWLPNKIEKAINKLENKNNDSSLPILYASKVTVVDQNLNLIKNYKPKIIKNITFGNSMIENIITGCTIVFNKQMLHEMQKVKDTNGIFLHDWFAYMIASSFGKIIYDENSYILYRQHSNNVIGLSKNSIYNYVRKFRLLIMYIKTNIIFNNVLSFYKIYSDKIPKEDFILIDNLLNKNILNRIYILFCKKIFRQSIIDTIIYKMLFFFKIL